ncbi:WD repeat-containing protein 97 [Heteronotia binoei]|uniref:WD repeat-containing protein 97 n=1 Tax=Heteronotia binoei TaxID=13085 RepID=UPI002931CC02|nr:WD repeat-containing protein 97 [Heteronotia binoei]
MEMAESSTPQKGKREDLGVTQRESQPDEAKESGSAGQIKGQQHWLQLQKGFRRAVEKIKNEEMKVTYLSHGLQHLRHISLLNPVLHIAHDCLKKVFVVLDTENGLHWYKEEGLYVSSRRAPVPMEGLLYASQADRFVAWDKGGLRVLNSGFEVLSEVQSALPIRCGLYSALLNRVVTAGEGNLAVWGFRYGYRSLQCRTIISEGLGPSAVFCRLALDTSGTEPQRCFASCDTGAAAFDVSGGTLISFKTKLHSRVITDIAYCEAVGSPVTASRDTTIKVWDETWHIRTVFVGHTGPVVALAVDPQRPLIFSASHDGTIRTWNLETIDQVDQVHISEPVESLETQTASCVISVSGLSLDLWKINKLYSLYVPLGSPARRLSCIDLKAVASFPVRIVCVCQDATVRVLDAPTGAVLAMLSLPPPHRVTEVAYSLPRETLFVLTESGSLLRVNAATDPMVVKKSVAPASHKPRPSCLLLYSHIMDPEKAYKTWLEVVANKSDRKAWQKPPLRMQDKNRYVLILGQEDGLLNVVDWFSGRIQCQVEAHHSQRVTALAEYTARTCIISAGADRTVKMWRVFPYVEESLVLLLCFSCAVPAWHLCCLHETLAVAFQDPQTVTYSIVHYNPMEQTCSEHGPEDDPLDDITGLCCCPNLKLFASSSRDGSVKIWNSHNKLLRHLKLNTIPESLAFANPQGDLLVGIERHLYLISHKKYLPSYYNMTLLCAQFLEPIQDTSVPITESSFKILVQDNVKWLKQEPPAEEARSHSIFRMPTQESKVIRGSEVEAKASLVLDLRDHDLQQLRTGKARAAKKVRFTKAMRDEAFEQFLQIFYKQQPQVKIPEEDVFNADEVLEALSRCGSISELYGPSLSNMFLGAFPQLASLEAPGTSSRGRGDNASAAISPGEEEAPATQETHLGRHSRRLGTDALAFPEDEARKWPGSTRAPFLGGRFFETVFGKAKTPREKLESELSLISEEDLRAPKSASWVGSLAGSTVLHTVDADRSEKSLSSGEALMPMRSRESVKLSQSSLRSRSQTLSRTTQEGRRDSLQTQMEPEGSQLLTRASSGGFTPNSVATQLLHIRESSSSPNVESLVRLIREREERESLSSASSVKRAAQDQQPGTQPLRVKSRSRSRTSTKESSSRVFLTQLDESHYPDHVATPEEEISAFHIRFKDSGWFQQLFPEDIPPAMDVFELLAMLLAALPTADFDTKTQLLEALLSLRGAWGPGVSSLLHSTLIGLLNVRKGAPSMKEESQQRFILAALRALLALDKDSTDLMVELMACYLQAPPAPRVVVEGLLEEMGVQDPHGCFYKEMDSWQVKKEGRKEKLRKVCSLWLEGAMQQLQEQREFLAMKEKLRGKHFCPYSPKPKLTSLQSVHPVDAVNHFVAQRLVARPEMTRDTVMALPPVQKRQAILRLGETNAMLRNRIPEHADFYFPYIFPRYLLKGFVPFVKLPLPKINLSPFPLESERPLSPETFTAKQQPVQKYYIPKFSYAESYP